MINHGRPAGRVVAMAHRGAHGATTAAVDVTAAGAATSDAAAATSAEGARGPGENTAAAVAAAAALGYAWVETDVRATADGHAVLAHDADLVRTAGSAAVVAQTTLGELAAACAAAGTQVTTLAQACAAAPSVHLNVDVKDARAVPAVLALAAADPALVARWRVTSFSESTRRAVVRGLRATAGVDHVSSSASAPLAAACWALAHAPAPRRWRGAALAAVRRAGGIDALQLPRTAALPPVGRGRRGVRRRVSVVDAALLDAAHRAGLEVHVWTVDDPAEMAELLDLGVDGLITDDAAALARVLHERGAWPPAAADREGSAGDPSPATPRASPVAPAGTEGSADPAGGW